MKILVTGATGFIGQHLVSHLSKKSHQIWCLVRKTSNKKTVQKLQNQGAKLVFADLKHIKKAKLPATFDWIFHLAALVDTTDKYPASTLLRENTKTTSDLAQIYLGKVKKFIFLSSMSAVGIANKNKLITEKTLCQPHTNYGRSKLQAETLLLHLFHQHQFPIVILRPPTVYGPGEHYNFLKLAQAIYRHRFWLIGKGKNQLSLCYVDNLIQAMLLAARGSRGVGEVFLVDDGHPYTLKQLAHAIAQAENREIPPYSLPYSLAYLAGFVFELAAKIIPLAPPLTRKRVITLTSNFAFDISKAKRVLKYHPEITLTKAVNLTISSFQKSNLLTP